MIDRRTLLRGLSALAFGATAMSAPLALADGFPAREVTLIVNYGAGGTTDTATRILAQTAEQYLGQPVAVINRSGGAGTAGPSLLAQSDADGYTVGVTSLSPLTVAPHTMDVPFETDDFTFIVGYLRYVYGIAVNANSAHETFEDLVEAARSGERVTIAVTSTDERILVENLNSLADVEFVAIPYQSGSEREVALLGDFVTMSIIGPGSANLRSGDLRLVAAAGPRRWSLMQDVPTLIEQGYDTAIESWAGLSAPAGTPDDIVDALRDAFYLAAQDPAYAEQVNGLGLDAAAMSGQEYGEMVRSRYASNGEWIERLGLAAN